jgi:hypothetical protein
MLTDTEYITRLKVIRTRLLIALNESLKLQSHYAKLLNAYDGGERMTFKNIEEWSERLVELKIL